MRYKITILINLFSGAGSGKSSLMARVFSELKARNIEVEMATEFAKDLVWEERYNTLGNQVYILGKQFQRINRLNNKVDVIITDSPLLFSIIYKRDFLSDTFDKLVLEIHHLFNNVNYFIKRVNRYNPKGRIENEQEAKEIDQRVMDVLNKNNIEFKNVLGNTTGAMSIVDDILWLLKNKGVK